jgi:microcystin-dependent protein
LPDTFTTNLNLTQPQVGSSGDTWGTKLNADLVAIDALFAPTGTGVVTRHDANDNAATLGVTISKAAGNGRWAQFLSSTSLRWLLGANTVAEGGSNAGSNFDLIAYADDGVTVLGTALEFVRSTLVGTFATTPNVGANAIYHQGNSALFAPVIGAVQIYAGSGDPAGGYWLSCDGRAISRTTYAALFTAIGTTYGAGDGTTTFNIPKTAERVIVGQSTTQTLITQYNATTLGNTFGEGAHSLVDAENGTHTHTLTDPGHAHTITGAMATTPNSGGSNINISATGASGVAPVTVSHTTGITMASDGSGTAHNNVQPSLVMNFIIRVQ